MKLLPIPGLPNYRVDCENQEVYLFRGYLRRIPSRTKYKIVSLFLNNKNLTSTVFRLMYCATNQIDITKIPSDICIGMKNGQLVVRTRSQLAMSRNEEKKKKKNLEQWNHNVQLISQYYSGNTEPMLQELQNIEKKISFWFIETYGLCKERADIVAAAGINCFLDRLADGFPSPYIYGSVLRYARCENNRIRKLSEFKDNMKVIEL